MEEIWFSLGEAGVEYGLCVKWQVNGNSIVGH